MIFKNSKVYDVLKWIALVGFYALNYLWVELADVWGFPYATEIGKTISIIGVALGIVLGISGIKYNESIKSKVNPFLVKTNAEDNNEEA